MKINGYIRVSSEEQSQQGISLSMQGEKISAYCAVNDLELTCIYYDFGISAKNIHLRPGFKEALSSVYGGEAEGLVVWKLDRAFRSTRDALATTDKLNKLGRDFVSVSEKIDTTSAIGKLFFTLMSAFGQFESDVTGERTTAALQQKRTNGEKLGGHTPFGFTITQVVRPDGRVVKRLEVNPVEQATIGRIRQWKSEGLSARGIARCLNNENCPTRTGARWSDSLVGKLSKRVG